METIMVHINEEHIISGVAGEPNQCPVALAIREKYGYGDDNWDAVSVTPWRVTIEGDTYKPVGETLTDFIGIFDDECHVDGDEIYIEPDEDGDPQDWILSAEIELFLAEGE